MKQVTNTVLMVRPVAFRMNEQTAINNYFQEDLALKNEEINNMSIQFSVIISCWCECACS